MLLVAKVQFVDDVWKHDKDGVLYLYFNENLKSFPQHIIYMYIDARRHQAKRQSLRGKNHQSF